MIPYICGGIGMLIWGRVSDRMNERRWNLLAACVLSTAGLVMAAATMGTWWALAGMSIAAIGFYGSKGPFFAMPPMFLSGTALASGIAWINSIGNLGGFFGPWYVGVMKDATGGFAGGLFGLALLSLIAALVCAFFLHIPDPTRADRTEMATPPVGARVLEADFVDRLKATRQFHLDVFAAEFATLGEKSDIVGIAQPLCQ